MKLNKSDFETQVWKKVEAVLQDRLNKYRTQNDQDLDSTKTAFYRGRIKEVKSLLDLAKANPVENTNDADE